MNKKSVRHLLSVQQQDNFFLFQIQKRISASLISKQGPVSTTAKQDFVLKAWLCSVKKANVCEIVLQLNFVQIGVELQIDLNSKYVSIDNFANGFFFNTRKMT